MYYLSTKGGGRGSAKLLTIAILMHACLLTSNIFVVVASLIFMGKTKTMEELMHNRMVVKAVGVQHHFIWATFFTKHRLAMIIRFAFIFSDKDIVFLLNPGS